MALVFDIYLCTRMFNGTNGTNVQPQRKGKSVNVEISLVRKEIGSMTYNVNEGANCFCGFCKNSLILEKVAC